MRRLAGQHVPAVDVLFAAGARDRLDAGVWAALADAGLGHRGTTGHPVDTVLMDGLM